MLVFCKKMLILIALVVGAGLLPDKTEGVTCYDCSSEWDCLSQKTEDCSSYRYDNARYYCYKKLDSSRVTERSCVTKSDKYEAECALSPEFKLVGGCFNSIQFDKIIKPCIERKKRDAYSREGTEEKNVTGGEEGGKGRVADGSGNLRTCYCKGDLCNDGDVPKDLTTRVDPDPDPVNCYACSDEKDCDNSNKENKYSKVLRCPIPYCMTMRVWGYSQSKPSSNNKKRVAYRGCAPWSSEAFDSWLGLQGSIDRIIECYKGVHDGCRNSKSVKTCLDEISPRLYVSFTRPYPYGDDFEECLCEGDLCNFDTPATGGVDGATRVSFTVVLSFIMIQAQYF